MSEKIDILNLKPGDALPGLEVQLSQEKINLYAEAVGDHNPIHVDEAFAAQSPFGGTIAHGMLILAFVSEMMTRVFGEGWSSSGKLSVRFKSPARSKDLITVSGDVESVSEDGDNLIFNCGISCANQNQDVIVIGQASAKVKKNT
jgi:3-hydroxybutyryl-CoA dehydratase